MTDPAQPTRTAHLIVGLPRSGTSAVAQLLSDGGIHFGDPAHFLDTAVHKHNPNFFEMEWVNQVNNLAIAALGSQYSDDFLPVESDFDDAALDPLRARIADEVRAEFGDAPHIGIKDPRFCFTFPLWQRVLERMGYAVSAVVTLRSEPACRRSNLALEPKWSDDRAWARFYLQSLLGARHFTRGVPTVVIDYDALMADPPGYAAALDLPGVNLAAATARLDPALVHQRPATDAGDTLVARVQRAFRDGTLRPDAYLDYRTVAALQVTTLAPEGMRACRAELTAAHAAIADQAGQLALHRQHADRLTEAVTVKDAAIEDHARRLAGLQQHADQLQDALTAAQAAAAQHQSNAAELDRQRLALQQHADQLTEALAAARSALDELERQRSAQQQHAEQLATALSAAQIAAAHHERRADELDRQRAAQQQHAAQLDAAVAAKQAALDHHVTQLAAAHAEVDHLSAQRATLRAGKPGWFAKAVTEAQLRPTSPGRFVAPAGRPMSGRARVELTASAEQPTPVSVYWDAGGAYDPARRVELGTAGGPAASFTAELALTEPALGFRIESADPAVPLRISRLRIFCVGR